MLANELKCDFFAIFFCVWQGLISQRMFPDATFNVAVKTFSSVMKVMAYVVMAEIVI